MRLISKVSAKHLGVEVAERWLEVVAQLGALYEEGGVIVFAERAGEIRTEVHLLAVYQAEAVEHQRAREAAISKPPQATGAQPVGGGQSWWSHGARRHWRGRPLPQRQPPGLLHRSCSAGFLRDG